MLWGNLENILTLLWVFVLFDSKQERNHSKQEYDYLLRGSRAILFEANLSLPWTDETQLLKRDPGARRLGEAQVESYLRSLFLNDG